MSDEELPHYENYIDYVSSAASLEAYQKQSDSAVISTETAEGHAGLLDYKAYAQEFPERLFPLVYHLRPEFQELFIEYHILGKSQSFLARTHRLVQSGWPMGVWQQLRIAERAIGAFILLGRVPSTKDFEDVFSGLGIEATPYGSLSRMFAAYAECQSYRRVAKQFGAPTPAVRKLFRPAVLALEQWKSKSPDRETRQRETVRAAAVGAYLRSLIHQASIKGEGINGTAKRRLRAIKMKKFETAKAQSAQFFSVGRVDSLREQPWYMMEISSDHQFTKVFPLIKRHLQKSCGGKHPVLVFAPTNEYGELQIGYILVKSNFLSKVQELSAIRGVSEISGTYREDGSLKQPAMVSNQDAKQLMTQCPQAEASVPKKGTFVRILSGEAAGYCGQVIKAKNLSVQVDFPTGRKFVVSATPDALEVLNAPPEKQAFWGVRP